MNQDAGGLPGRLPAAVRIQDGEDIAAFLARTAAANYRAFTDLTGHPRTARIWEAPPDQLLAALARLTGVSAARLRQATLAVAFPAADLHHARLGRRWSGQPAQCPDCGVGTTGARLNLIATCPECGALLTDRLDPHPPPAPPQLVTVQAQVVRELAAATRSSRARDRLHRLGQLVSDLEPALWPNWPPLLKGESPEWRERVVRCSQWALHTDGFVARPPSVTATLVALTWQASADPGSTRHLRDASAQMADRWNPDPGDLPPWRTHREAARGLRHLLRDLDVRPEHVPSILRRPEDPLILPPYLQPARIAGALTLTVIAGRAHHGQMSLTDATKLLAATVPAQARRLAETQLLGTHSLRRLAPTPGCCTTTGCETSPTPAPSCATSPPCPPTPPGSCPPVWSTAPSPLPGCGSMPPTAAPPADPTPTSPPPASWRSPPTWTRKRGYTCATGGNAASPRPRTSPNRPRLH